MLVVPGAGRPTRRGGGVGTPSRGGVPGEGGYPKNRDPKKFFTQKKDPKSLEPMVRSLERNGLMGHFVRPFTGRNMYWIESGEIKFNTLTKNEMGNIGGTPSRASRSSIRW